MVSKRPGSFRELFETELASMPGPDPDRIDVDGFSEVTGEPYVRTLGDGLFGLAFSGGGIRSATFNLGVLTALERLGVLARVDYLSTVSGGGYIGAWWTRWLERSRREFGDDLTEGKARPRMPPPGPGNPEPTEVRHLRQFSRFLIPRIGLLSSETGTTVVTVLAPLLATMGATLVLFLAVGCAYQQLSGAFREGGETNLAAFTLLCVGVLEWWWRREGKADPEDRRPFVYSLVSVLAAAAAGGALALISNLGTIRSKEWGWLLSNPHVWEFAPTVAWVSGALLWFFLRVAGSRFVVDHGHRTVRGAVDRLSARLLLLAAGWAGLTVVWIAGQIAADAVTKPGVLASILVSVTSGSAFSWVTRSVEKALRDRDEKSPTLQWGPLAAKILAYLTIGVVLVGAFGVSAHLLHLGFGAIAFWASLLSFVGVLWLFDPWGVSLHGAYRARIARAYLGAPQMECHTSSVRSDERATDDAPLSSLSEGQLPIHLICCAAADSASDRLATLGRGARSAVLSRFGLSIGDQFSTLSKIKGPPLTLASGVTASAAALNPVMGPLSLSLGPAVTFLMAALNLRLGLWVRRTPTNDRDVRWHASAPLTVPDWLSAALPGTLFLAEMFGYCRADGSSCVVHLTDGGHFENLGLYELVRRHCRYIVVSDCGCDPDYQFEDLANAIRLVRQDFGAEVRIDVDALRPDENGRAKRSVAVGHIEYPDGEKGTLVLLKPVLCDDEPDDVLQYSRANKRFPQEPTADQFYDQAQWESYRRLGEHVAATSFKFVARERFEARLPWSPEAQADLARIFALAWHEWYPMLPSMSEHFLNLTERCHEIGREIRESAPLWLAQEVYPELSQVIGHSPLPVDQRSKEDWRASLHLVVQVGQLMEDVWLACDLDAHADHPMNIGWMNYFHRWCASPTFRMWWPIVRPIWGTGFRRFAEERFRLGTSRDALDRGRVREVGEGEVAKGALRLFGGDWIPKGDRTVLFEIELAHEEKAWHVAVGALSLTYLQADGLAVARWASDDFRVLLGLWGAGAGRAFLRALVKSIQNRSPEVVRMEVELRQAGSSTSGEADRVREDVREFYIREGFEQRQGRLTRSLVVRPPAGASR